MTNRLTRRDSRPPSSHPADGLVPAAGHRGVRRRKRAAAGALAIVVYAATGASASPNLELVTTTDEALDRVFALDAGAPVAMTLGVERDLDSVPPRRFASTSLDGATPGPSAAEPDLAGGGRVLGWGTSEPAAGDDRAAPQDPAVEAAELPVEPATSPALSAPAPEVVTPAPEAPDAEAAPSPAPPALAPTAAVPAPVIIAVHLAPDPPPGGSPEDAIATFFFELYDEALAVATCESSLDPGAVSSGGGNHGLFQVNDVHRPAFEAATGTPFDPGVYDPFLNAQFARQLYDESGWDPWACQP